MEITQLIYLLNNPNEINLSHIEGLESIIQKYPYFQSVKALYIKALYNQESFKYNYELKKTACYTKDREILFDFITSKDFTVLDKSVYKHQEKTINEIDVSYESIEETIQLSKETPPIAFGITEDTFKEEVIETAERLELGKPLNFEASEKHSFMEWLKLTQIQKINTEASEQDEASKNVQSNEDSTEVYIDFDILNLNTSKEGKKKDLIDDFLSKNPKIVPKKEVVEPPKSITNPVEEINFTTETLAKIYTEQKKYQKAIQAYEILILKYPEKSVFFADRIKDIKFLQQNKL